MAAPAPVSAQPRGPLAGLPWRTRPSPVPAWSYAVRQLQFWLTDYRRTWRGSIVSTVLNPLLYLGAMGLGLGTLVDKHGTASLGQVSYLVFLAPGLLAASAMGTGVGESTYPVFGSVKWNNTYQAAVSSPLRPADLFHGHLLFVGLKLTMTSSVFLAVAAAFGAIISPWAILALPVAVLTGLAFTAVIEAWTVTRTKDTSLAVVYRFGLIPLFLFSGTFFPVTQLPAWIRPIAYLTPLWHGVALCRGCAWASRPCPSALLRIGYAAGRAGGRDHRREPDLHQAAVCLAARYGAAGSMPSRPQRRGGWVLGGSMSSVRRLPLRVLPGRRPLRRAARSVGGRSSLFLVERHALVYRHTWLVFVSGVVEPLFYLLSIGVGLGHLVGSVQGISYAAFVAPALLASASMNGALFDSTFNVFFRLKYDRATTNRRWPPRCGPVTWPWARSAGRCCAAPCTRWPSWS